MTRSPWIGILVAFAVFSIATATDGHNETEGHQEAAEEAKSKSDTPIAKLKKYGTMNKNKVDVTHLIDYNVTIVQAKSWFIKTEKIKKTVPRACYVAYMKVTEEKSLASSVTELLKIVQNLLDEKSPDLHIFVIDYRTHPERVSLEDVVPVSKRICHMEVNFQLTVNSSENMVTAFSDKFTMNTKSGDVTRKVAIPNSYQKTNNLNFNLYIMLDKGKYLKMMIETGCLISKDIRDLMAKGACNIKAEKSWCSNSTDNVTQSGIRYVGNSSTCASNNCSSDQDQVPRKCLNGNWDYEEPWCVKKLEICNEDGEDFDGACLSAVPKNQSCPGVTPSLGNVIISPSNQMLKQHFTDACIYGNSKYINNKGIIVNIKYTDQTKSYTVTGEKETFSVKGLEAVVGHNAVVLKCVNRKAQVQAVVTDKTFKRLCVSF